MKKDIRPISDRSGAAKRLWTERPVGFQRSSARPGDPAFFRDVRQYRYEYETPWIPSFFSFANLNSCSVLEIGVGLGIDAVEMIRAGAKYSGIDVTSRHLELAADNVRLNCGALAENANFIEGDLLDVSVRGPFDVIYSFGVLHHVVNEFDYLCRIRGLLAEDGVFRLAVYSKYSFFNAYLYLTWLFRNRMRTTFTAWQSHIAELTNIDDPVTIRVRSRREVERLLRRAHLRPIRYRKQGFVQKYIPLLGKYLNPSGALLSFAGRLLGWYHCYECVAA